MKKLLTALLLFITMPIVAMDIPNEPLEELTPPSDTETITAEMIATAGDNGIACSATYTILASAAQQSGDTDHEEYFVNQGVIALTMAAIYGEQLGVPRLELVTMYKTNINEIVEGLTALPKDMFDELVKFCEHYVAISVEMGITAE